MHDPGSAPRRISLALELEASGEAVRGTLAGEGELREFGNWIELVAGLRELTRAVPPPGPEEDDSA